jgi:hypothetical protein
MLEIHVASVEGFNEKTNEFITIPEVTLQLEHSLISISKWESKWHKPFMQSSNKLNQEEIIDYIKCMTVSPGKVDPAVYYMLSQKNIDDIIAYIQNPMTATWFKEEEHKKASKEIITSELIYYWMVALQIPFECQKWHINRLLTLIRVCNAKNEEQNPNRKKMGQRELMSRNAALNAQRRAKLHSKG